MFVLVAKKNTNIGLRLSDELREKLAKKAEANKRTLSDYIRLLLEECVEKQDLQPPSPPKT